MDWVKVCVTNTSEVELHMLDRELLSSFSVFVGQPAKEGGTRGTCWMAHGLYNHASAGSRGIDDWRGLSQNISWGQGLTPYRSSSLCPSDIR